MDATLRAASLWIAAFAGALSLASLLFDRIHFILHPATVFVVGTATFLIMRMLLNRTYREGIDAVNREMGEKHIKFGDPDWGLFGRRTGTLPLLWLRAILIIGIIPAALLQHWNGIDVGYLWSAGAFLAIELSIMHAALSQPR